MSQNDIQAKIASFTCIEEALDYFDIGFDSRFIDKHRVELVKRFNGYLILTKSLSQKGFIPNNEATSKMQHGLVVFDFLLPTNKQSTITV